MKRHPLLAFFVLMLVLSWAFWLPLAVAPGYWLKVFKSPERLNLAIVLGAYGPCLAAMIVTVWTEGVPGLRKLLGGLLRWRVGWVWYIVALLLPAGISLMATALDMMFGGNAPDFSSPRIYQENLPIWPVSYNVWMLLVPIFLLEFFVKGALGEEIGWRGFALSRLQRKLRALDAALIVAFAWTVWSQPYWHILQRLPGAHSSVLVLFLVTLFGAMPAQVLTTWLYNSTGGSLLLVALFNNALKVTFLFVATSPDTPPGVPVAAIWLTTLVVVSAVGTSRLTLRTVPETTVNNNPQPPSSGASP